MKFTELEIDKELIDVAEKQGFEALTPIQEKCVPEILSGRDIVGQGETGSGKTVAFALPILNNVFTDEGMQVLVLTPTRELCVQVANTFIDFGQPLGIRVAKIYGGVAINPQIEALKTANVVVGTPGRILDHIGRGTLSFYDLKFLVLDEADRMFDMGFIDDVEKIINKTPVDIQVAMFSATISDPVYRIMSRHMRDPLLVKTQPQVDPAKLKQTCYDLPNAQDKFSLLVHLIKNETPGLAIVFCATRSESDFIARNLRYHGISASAIHGGMSQNKRLESLDRLKHEKIDVLVATDVAARGLDIKNVTHVYNYDVASCAKEYLHRIGRTARAGEDGDAITLLTPRDHDNYRNINQDYGGNIEMKALPTFPKFELLKRVRCEQSKRGGSYSGSRGSRPGAPRGGGSRRGPSGSRPRGQIAGTSSRRPSGARPPNRSRSNKS